MASHLGQPKSKAEKHIHTYMIILMKMVNPNSGVYYQQDLITYLRLPEIIDRFHGQSVIMSRFSQIIVDMLSDFPV